MRILIYFVIFAVLGIAYEVFWRGVRDAARGRNKTFFGASNLWMFPIFGALVFIIIFVQKYFAFQPWFVRGLLYMLLIYGWEFLSGSLLGLFKIKAWDYSQDVDFCHPGQCIRVGSKKRFDYKGLVCLEYAPVWFIGGLLAEWLYLFLESHLIL